MKIAEFLLQTLELSGIRFIFGNPGTTEVPLVHACDGRRGIQYVVTLSEVSAVPMADGYARATRSLGVVNLHVAPGLGNGMGGLYTAGIAQTPLLVLVGGQDRRFLHTQPILWGPVEKMAGTVAKAVFALDTRYDVVPNIRRALRTALTPPYGPVAVICPPDLLEQDIDESPAPVRPAELGGLSRESADEYARLLRAAAAPAFIAAEDVHWNGAGDALERLAEYVAAPIYIAPYTGAVPVSSRSPHYAGYLPPSLTQIAKRLAAHDVLFFVGGRGMRLTLYSEATLPQTKLWIGNNPDPIPVEGEFALAAVTDTRAGLTDIATRLHADVSRRSMIAASLRPDPETPPEDPAVFHPSRAVRLLIEAFPDAIYVDESGISTSDVKQLIQVAAGEYLINGSGGIGWGLAASVGVALGHPDRQVVALIGDGSALYASEALWTASHHGTKVLLIILSNRRYATLNEAARRLVGRSLDLFTIEPPVIDFSGLATLYGWCYAKVGSEKELGGFLAQTGDRVAENTLLELTLDPAVGPVGSVHHF